MTQTKFKASQVEGMGLPDGTLLNGRITPSISSNNLVLELKTYAGLDPSTSDPSVIFLGGIPRQITAALSVTITAGTNVSNAGSAELATKEHDRFVYLGYNAVDGVVIGSSRISYAQTYADFSTTATNEKYCAISNISNASATDCYVNIGRFAATLSAGAGYTWTVPTFTPLNLINYPIFETRRLSAASTLTGFTGTPTQTVYYQLTSARMIFYISVSGTSNATGFTATMPFTPTTNIIEMQKLVDAGAGVAGLFSSSGATITFYASVISGNFTNSGTKGCEGTLKSFFI